MRIIALLILSVIASCTNAQNLQRSDEGDDDYRKRMKKIASSTILTPNLKYFKSGRWEGYFEFSSRLANDSTGAAHKFLLKINRTDSLLSGKGTMDFLFSKVNRTKNVEVNGTIDSYGNVNISIKPYEQMKYELIGIWTEDNHGKQIITGYSKIIFGNTFKYSGVWSIKFVPESNEW